MRITREKKEAHSIVGKQIKLILSITPAEYDLRWEETAYAGEVYTIVERPFKRARKNGDAGVWIEGRLGPVFAWFFTWEPYFPPKQMQRTKQTSMLRTKHKDEITRTKINSMLRTK
jgi:hypothetical protein